MKNKVLTLVTMLVIFLFGASLATAQDPPAGQDQSAAQSTSEKPAKAHHAAASKAETVSGTVSAVDADKRFRTPRAVAMNEFGYQFFASPGLTCHQ